MNEHYFNSIGALPSHKGLWRAYALGYVLSLACTLLAFWFATHASTPRTTLLIIAVLALVQCAIQGMCFLHLEWNARSKMKLVILGFAVLVVGILVSGSLWIIFTLNSRMMPDQQTMEQYMQNQDGF